MISKTRKSIAALLVTAGACVALSGSAFAFDDVKQEPGASYILDLKHRGIVQGVGNNLFKPAAHVSGATAVTLLVKGLDLNIDNIRFIKKPEAGDYYTKIPNDAPYAEAFIIAQLNGLDIPRDIDPKADVTREQFAHWLFQALSTKGEYAFTEQYVLVAGEEDVTPAYSGSLQKLLIAGIAELGANNEFRPQEAITRGEAAVMLDKTIAFAENVKPIPDAPETTILTDVKLESASLTEGVSKVTLTATAPHPGYGIQVSSIAFDGDQAIVNYRVVMPDPDKMYPQVVTSVETVTYISSSYKAVLGTVEQGDASTASGGGDGVSGSTGFPIAE